MKSSWNTASMQDANHFILAMQKPELNIISQVDQAAKKNG